MGNRSDNFNRADTAVALGTPSDGGSAWVESAGTWGISSNRAYKTVIEITFETAVLEASSADVDVSVVATTLANSGIALRQSNNSNFILVQILSGSLTVYRRVAGTFTQVGSAYSGAISNGDTIRATISGANGDIVVYQNGVSRVTTSSNAGATNTRHGLMVHTVASRFDDFALTDIAAAVASLVYYQPAIGPLLVR